MRLLFGGERLPCLILSRSDLKEYLHYSNSCVAQRDESSWRYEEKQDLVCISDRLRYAYLPGVHLNMGIIFSTEVMGDTTLGSAFEHTLAYTMPTVT